MYVCYIRDIPIYSILRITTENINDIEKYIVYSYEEYEDIIQIIISDRKKKCKKKKNSAHSK